ncbi:LytTR family DNA-binding domain-containing protein [Chitinophaga sp. YIM B06452]|uniref:LytR/AlgR family response regulator transcription factor n=1 Tax=Chitinophaga sp. YIM B06452 TaxID=3082158 RepID=UPI0031FF0D12
MINQPFFIWDDRKYVKINLNEIMVLKSEDNYLRFLAQEYSYQVRATLDRTLSLLPDNLFVRIHKSYAVSLHHLEEVEKDVVKIGGLSLPVSKKFYGELISRLNVIR